MLHARSSTERSGQPALSGNHGRGGGEKASKAQEVWANQAAKLNRDIENLEIHMLSRSAGVCPNGEPSLRVFLFSQGGLQRKLNSKRIAPACFKDKRCRNAMITPPLRQNP